MAPTEAENPTSPTLTTVIGLEIHCELDTRTKMFCRCLNRFGDPPNTHTCPVCIGMPGALPVMNRQAVDMTIKAGLALNCQVPEFTKWDRKGYYYPDLPKNYQISQYDLPLAREGYLDVPLPGGRTSRIRVRRAHLEEDAGKNVHDLAAHTGVDLNRAGVPLLEIVSEPDIHSVEEVMGYSRSMRRLVRWLGISQANMQMGHMRFEPNISIWVGDGQRIFDESAGYFTPILEIKNLNSFRSLEKTVEWIIDYHRAQIIERGRDWSLEKVGKQNWGYRDDLECCEFQRGKEEAHDYRYFPDPDLAPVRVEAAWRDRIAAEIGELPIARKGRYLAQYQLSDKEADALTEDAPTGDLLDSAVKLGGPVRRVVNLMMGRMMAASNQKGSTLAQLGVSAEALAELAGMMEAGKLSASAADRVMEVLLAEGGKPLDIATRLGVLAVSDASAIEAWVDAAIAANAGPAEQVRTGDKKAKQAFGFLMGAVMKLSGGKAPPAAVKQLLEQKLSPK
jgi:aspartyl-tRNA(Asn)/glutamyl-tRNA(Gln) amidotransferase subunit B